MQIIYHGTPATAGGGAEDLYYPTLVSCSWPMEMEQLLVASCAAQVDPLCVPGYLSLANGNGEWSRNSTTAAQAAGDAGSFTLYWGLESRPMDDGEWI